MHARVARFRRRIIIIVVTIVIVRGAQKIKNQKIKKKKKWETYDASVRQNEACETKHRKIVCACGAAVSGDATRSNDDRETEQSSRID